MSVTSFLPGEPSSGSPSGPQAPVERTKSLHASPLGKGIPLSSGVWTGWRGHFTSSSKPSMALEQRGIALKSITEPHIDTSTPGGRLVFNIFGSIAEFERAIIRERTKAGVTAAKARGRNGGRPPKLTGERADHARNLLAAGSSVSSVARSMGVSRAAVHRSMERIAEAE
jgi:hypothetical protein